MKMKNPVLTRARTVVNAGTALVLVGVVLFLTLFYPPIGTWAFPFVSVLILVGVLLMIGGLMPGLVGRSTQKANVRAIDWFASGCLLGLILGLGMSVYGIIGVIGSILGGGLFGLYLRALFSLNTTAK